MNKETFLSATFGGSAAIWITFGVTGVFVWSPAFMAAGLVASFINFFALIHLLNLPAEE